MNDYFGIRGLVVTEDQLKFLDMSSLSKLARDVLASSNNPAISSLADRDLQRANESARALARKYFQITPPQ